MSFAVLHHPSVSVASANLTSLLIEWRIQKRVEEQFSAFLSGFNELIPPELVNVFDERELELLIGGITDIDIDDWKKHTDYRGYTESDEVIKNFWTVGQTHLPKWSMADRYTTLKCIRSWDAEQKSRLLQFATGTSRIPVNGFKDLQGSDGPRRFTIERAGDGNGLPKSHTWYAQSRGPSSSSFKRLLTFTASTGSIYHRIKRRRLSCKSSPSQWRKRLASGKSRAAPELLQRCRFPTWTRVGDCAFSSNIMVWIG